MEIPKFLFFLILPVLATFTGGAVFGASPWEVFLNQPDKKRFVELENSISAPVRDCVIGKSKYESIFPEKIRPRLFAMVADGNEFAFQAGVLVLPCLDGGDREDLLISSGLFFEKEPHKFLDVLKEKKISEDSALKILIMIPLETTDLFDLQLRIVQKRMSILRDIKDESSERIVNKGLSALKESEEQIKKTIELLSQ